MPVTGVYDIENKKIAEIELSDAVFGAPVNEAVIYDAIRMQAPDGGCAGIPARGASDAAAMSPARDAEEAGGGAGEPQRGGEAPVDPFQARIWAGP